MIVYTSKGRGKSKRNTIKSIYIHKTKNENIPIKIVRNPLLDSIMREGCC